MREFDNKSKAFLALTRDDIIWIDGNCENQRVIVINGEPDHDGHIYCIDLKTRRPVWVCEYTHIISVEFPLDNLDDI